MSLPSLTSQGNNFYSHSHPDSLTGDASTQELQPVMAGLDVSLSSGATFWVSKLSDPRRKGVLFLVLSGLGKSREGNVKE